MVKFFNPLGAATWLATELDGDGDTLFGLADLGFGCPELGSFSLAEIAALRLPFGLGIERDLCFASAVPLSVWADTARRAGSILWAAQLARAACATDRPNQRFRLASAFRGRRLTRGAFSPQLRNPVPPNLQESDGTGTHKEQDP